MREAVLLKEQFVVEKDNFYYDVVEGLTASQKSIQPKYFYDAQGSEYFDQICDLKEYYPYKTELKLLPRVAKELAQRLPNNYSLIEFGAGSLLKVKPLLTHINGIRQFIPIDISGEHLRASCRALEAEFPNLDVCPVEGDFTQVVDVERYTGNMEKVGFFPGSTIGNLNPDEALAFLRNVGKTLGKNSYLLIGVDTKKSPATLHKAYNDASGVTAKFNLNVIDRINRHFDNGMDKEKFEHYAYYNAVKGCIEMHLVCIAPHSVELDDVVVDFERGESIHTENSFKYAPAEFEDLAATAGWRMDKLWLAEDDMFSIFLLQNKVA